MSPNVSVNPSQSLLTSLPLCDPKIRIFHQSLPHYSQTPLVSLPAIAHELGIRHLLLKDETSRLGLTAFKILGASWATVRSVTKRLGLETAEHLKSSDSLVPDISLQDLASAAQAADLTLYADLLPRLLILLYTQPLMAITAALWPAWPNTLASKQGYLCQVCLTKRQSQRS